MKKTMQIGTDFTVIKESKVFPFIDEDRQEAGGDWLLLLTHPYIGQDDALGGTLMKEYLQALCRETIRPAKIVFTHDAVAMLLGEAPFVTELCNLQRQGVGLFVCAVSAEYLCLKNRLCGGEPVSWTFISQLIAQTMRVVVL